MSTWPTKELRDIWDDEIKEKFIVAIDMLFQRDIFLLQNGVREDGSELERGAHERSVAHKLAEYLQQQFPEWNVDCDYNRRERGVKVLSGSDIFPDIVVHHRGVKDNLLVVELKTSDVKEDKDFQKLIGLTSAGDYEYQLGVFLRLVDLEIKELIWYKNGQIEN